MRAITLPPMREKGRHMTRRKAAGERTGSALYVKGTSRPRTKRLAALAGARGMNLRDFLGVGEDPNQGLLALYEAILVKAKDGGKSEQAILEACGIGVVDV